MAGSKQYIYEFEKGDGKNKMLLGGKGANLCEMTQIGLNVPPGFTITTDACNAYLEKNQLPDGLMDDIKAHMKALEKKTGKGFGSSTNPLLVSVRSGSSMSMPGMMDTILNLGLNETSLKGLIKQTSNERFAYDAYRRFIQLFGKIALNISDEHFDERMAAIKRKYGAPQDVDLKTEHLKELAAEFLAIVQNHSGKPFPQDPYEQLEIAVGAVFRSWMGKRAVDYRRQFRITKDQASGTAVNICTMVFGNMGNDSGTGVGFTRNPGTGENLIYGEYLTNAQGEDVVAGIRTPKAIAEMEKEMPEIYRQLMTLHNRLESHYHEVQDFEFTIEKGILYCLQTRNGKMNARGMVRSSGGNVQRRTDHQGTRPAAHRTGDPGTTAGAATGAQLPRQVAGTRPARLTRRGIRQDRVRRRHRRSTRPRRRKDHPGARRNQAGRHPRLLPGTGHPDQPRRQDLARCRGGARHGQALRLGLRSRSSSTTCCAARRSARPHCMKATSSPSTAAPAMCMRAKCRQWSRNSPKNWSRCWPGRMKYPDSR